MYSTARVNRRASRNRSAISVRLPSPAKLSWKLCAAPLTHPPPAPRLPLLRLRSRLHLLLCDNRQPGRPGAPAARRSRRRGQPQRRAPGWRRPWPGALGGHGRDTRERHKRPGDRGAPPRSAGRAGEAEGAPTASIRRSGVAYATGAGALGSPRSARPPLRRTVLPVRRCSIAWPVFAAVAQPPRVLPPRPAVSPGHSSGCRSGGALYPPRFSPPPRRRTFGQVVGRPKKPRSRDFPVSACPFQAELESPAGTFVGKAKGMRQESVKFSSPMAS